MLSVQTFMAEFLVLLTVGIASTWVCSHVLCFGSSDTGKVSVLENLRVLVNCHADVND